MKLHKIYFILSPYTVYINTVAHLKSSHIFLSFFFSRKETRLMNSPRSRLLSIYKIVQFGVSLRECWLHWCSYPAVFTYAIAKQSYSPYGHNQVRGKGSTSSASAASFGGFVLPGGMFLLIYETQRTLYRLWGRLGQNEVAREEKTLQVSFDMWSLYCTPASLYRQYSTMYRTIHRLVLYIYIYKPFIIDGKKFFG